ncbi:MAG: PD-(D/E)XK nuclease family protein [Methanobrevibacter sp.]|uniref:PD-(D/E)XK nuclease family protein n=1 Tax=Methanobrevibacter sp. TaxID=66852 RepID=UPI0025D52372|nr:PD-(D/E)XK nuclease family protein [Methanobrevibacter sp.]MBR3113284.1 PD-(D/E)XK nuclease family protein [Methanobrevibacter sp.]MBR6993402.1 PD-(D/E)XK nuclease family protein [Methanobrevibacter sp.]
MKLPSRSKSYIIPEYSLTGDLLSFLTCNLQYRYQNKGTLPPSKPVQRWFGEFIHGVLEEAFIQWKNEQTEFPWDWKQDIRPIEDRIDLRLQVRGLYPHDEDLFFSILNQPDSDMTIDDLNEHDHKKLASARAEKAINIWGKYLFPLIDSSEMLIKGIREMPNYKENISRSNYYGINGVVDVLTSMKINKTLEQSNLDNYDNKIIEFLKKDPDFQRTISQYDEGEDYEIIIDYKGMKRPPYIMTDEKSEDKWENHKQQILTYSWLRSKQEDSKPIVAGIIFYLNELVPSKEDLVLIKDELNNDLTDVGQSYGNDVDLINGWEEEDKAPDLSDDFKIARSIRIINVDETEQEHALKKFDRVVANIENSLIKEMKGCKIQDAWKADSDERTCSACDFRTFCKNNSVNAKDFKIP